MLDKIAHVAIAVKSIDESLKFYRDVLNIKVGDRKEVPDQGVEACFLDTGDTKIELLQPLDENSGVYKFIEKRGEGIHHICFEVKDIKSALKHLTEQGIQLIDKEPRISAHGCPIAFVHPKSTGGVLIELEEVG